MSPLPRVTNQPAALVSDEPIYQSRYEINIMSEMLSEHESILISDNFISIKKNIMKLNGNLDTIVLLRKLDKFNFSIKLFDKTGEVKMILYYIDVIFKNFDYDILDFDYQSDGLYQIELSFVLKSRMKFNI